ncbi:MAG: hypothetical protein ABIL04_03205 [candidate division WOR-3 bacterium]
MIRKVRFFLLLLSFFPFLLLGIGWPLPPGDSVYPLGNNWGNFQDYGGGPYFHNGIDAITVGQHNRPVIAVSKGWVKAWLTIEAELHWRLAICDSNLSFTGRAPGWLYAHIDPNRYHKQEGDSVLPGDTIGYLVYWSVSGFDHIHFARISDTGSLWRRGSSQPQNPTWWFIQNPLTIIQPNTDTVRPVFENARTGQLFAFCRNNSSTYFNDLNNLNGDVDIIAKIYDKTGFSTGNPTWDKLAPYKIKYSIRGRYARIPETLSLIFKYGLPPSGSNEIRVVYKDDATCNSRGDYNNRDYYFIVTNTDGDSLIEMSDTTGKWRTQNFPDDYYWVKVIAEDVCGNWRAESILVKTNNNNPIRDVGVTKILSPTGMVDSGTVIIPACSLYNYGGVNENYRVRMKIGNFYNDTARITNHSPETYRYLTFRPWEVKEVGNHPVSCSTELANDMDLTNDKKSDSVKVQRPVIRDVGCQKILAPTGTIDSGSSVIPACSVYNYGNTQESYSVRMKIGDFYDEVTSVFNHLPGTSYYLTFPPITFNYPRGSYFLSCSTQLFSDTNPANDKKVDSLKIIVKDVGTISLLLPSVIDSGCFITPACSVYNFGDQMASYWVRLKIGNFYLDTVWVANHQPGIPLYYTFSMCQMNEIGTHLASCSTELTGDMHPENNKKAFAINVQRGDFPDVGVKVIVAPKGLINLGEEVIPACTVFNYGNTQESYSVRMKIGDFYNEVTSVSNHLPGTSYYLTFPLWLANQSGVYLVSCSTELFSDRHPENDRKSDTALVIKPSMPAGWIKIGDVPLEPDGKKIKSGGAIVVVNETLYLIKGNNTRNLYKYFFYTTPPPDPFAQLTDSLPLGPSGKNVKKGSAMTTDGRYLYIAKGANTKEFYRYDTKREEPIWETLPPIEGERGLKGGTGLAYLNGYIYLLKGSNTKEFYRYHIQEKFWERRRDALGIKGYGDGSSLVAYDDTSIFLLQGKYNNFYRYHPEKDSWYEKSPLPFYHPQLNRKKKAKEGAALAGFSGLGSIFAFKGGNTNEFWKYEPIRDTWIGLETIHLGPERKRVKGGGSLCASGSENFIKIGALKGNNSTSIWGFFIPDPERIASHPGVTPEKPLPPQSLNLSITSSPAPQFPSVKIYNALGFLIGERKSRGLNLPNGIYFLEVKMGNRIKRQKIIFIK